MATQRTTKKSTPKTVAPAAKPRSNGRSKAAAASSTASSKSPSPKPSDPGVNTMNRILLVDLGERETKKRQELRARRQVLQTIDKTADTSGGLSPRQLDELAQIKTKLSSDVVVDPFYQLVTATQQQKDWNKLACATENVHKYGLIGSQRSPKELRGPLGCDEREIIGICGLLQLDGYTDASLRGFVQRVSAAQGEYRENRALFDAAFELLVPRYQVTIQSQIASGLIDADIVGCEWPDDNPEDRRDRYSTDTDFRPSAKDTVCALSSRNLAATVRRLASNGIGADNAWLASHLQNGYEMQTGVVAGAPPSAMEIILPDLEDSTDVEIVRENLNAVQAIYFAYMLEETRMPQVVERIVELFRSGMLPLGRGKAGDYLFRYYKTAAERITEGERRDLYMRCFGAPGGDPNGNEPNREFNELWLRFLSAVSSFGRQLSVDRMLRTNVPVAVSQEQVRKAARDLGASLSRSGYGIAYFAATELQQMILEYRDLLSDPEVRGAFGARDMWQVIDQVNANYLGGPRNTSRFRTQARAGAVIIRWIANTRQRLEGRYGEVISISALTNPQLRGSDQPTVDPTDWDLLQACEQWLAVGGVQDNSVEQYAQPAESPVITSRPIEMPQAARDLLNQAGISLPGL
ncbi:hypothetical protein ABQU74_15545 [Xanthomonas sp. WHRI 10208]|uniref:hypothetical protein n=2 Tax=Xanthomonas TaxID=338 RepID=UPI0012902960